MFPRQLGAIIPYNPILGLGSQDTHCFFFFIKTYYTGMFVRIGCSLC